MRICDLNTPLARLIKSARRLREQWDETKTHWSDQNAVEFEEQYLQPLVPQLTLTTAAVNRLAALLTQIERECADRDEIE
jgi:hypothetical protein